MQIMLTVFKEGIYIIFKMTVVKDEMQIELKEMSMWE